MFGKGHHISQSFVQEHQLSWVIPVSPSTKDGFWWAWEALLQSLALINSSSPAVISHRYPVNQLSLISCRKCPFSGIFRSLQFYSYNLIKFWNNATVSRILHISQRSWRYLGVLREAAWLQNVFFYLVVFELLKRWSISKFLSCQKWMSKPVIVR